ncbi:hypothetical protein [Pseudoalteromonas galatheae]|uniref:hypothetical protein n=1 Tax=Pseudoalteromonas galatheae TaxID=579562 RepID=UPI0030CDC9DE
MTIDYPKVRDDIQALLANLPVGVKVEYSINNSKVIWSITERPIDFSPKDSKTLIDKLNAASVGLQNDKIATKG